MARPLPVSPDPAQRLATIAELAGRLSRDCGVTIKYVHLPPRQLADWFDDGVTRTFCVAADATLDQQVWAYLDLVKLLAIGPHACSGAHETPLLRVVPEPAVTHLPR